VQQPKIKPGTVTGTDADLRKLTMPQTERILRGFGQGRASHPRSTTEVSCDITQARSRTNGLRAMTKCVKPFGHLATSSTVSSKWSVLIGRA
jgi:hypothetical protein